MVNVYAVRTHFHNKFIEFAILKLSRKMPLKKLNLFVCDIQSFLLALARGEVNARTDNVVLVYNNDLEVFIVQSIFNISFIALDVRTRDVFDFFEGTKVYKKLKPFKHKEDSVRMRVFFLILRGCDDVKICNDLLITQKKLREYKSQLTYGFFNERRNLFYLTLNGFLQAEVMAA